VAATGPVGGRAVAWRACPGFQRCRIETDRPRSGVASVGTCTTDGVVARPQYKRRGELTGRWIPYHWTWDWPIAGIHRWRGNHRTGTTGARSPSAFHGGIGGIGSGAGGAMRWPPIAGIQRWRSLRRAGVVGASSDENGPVGRGSQTHPPGRERERAGGPAGRNTLLPFPLPPAGAGKGYCSTRERHNLFSLQRCN